MDSDKLDAKQGLWYQTGYNVGDTRGGINAPIGDMFLPEVLGQDKICLLYTSPSPRDH